MGFDPVVAVIVVLVVVVALILGGTMLADRENKREMLQLEASRREERAHQERLEKEQLERFAEARREEAGAMESARKQMAFAQEEISHAQQAFRRYHDQLVSAIHLQAKAECDALFRQRFGITRLAKAPNPENDEDVQAYLREHYANLRDAILAKAIGALVEGEIARRLSQLEEEASLAAPEVEASDDIIIDRAPVEEAVRDEYDIDGIRTYLLAAISARYGENGRPIADLPWPAYTTFSTRGYGELCLAEGAPVYAQDAYREFAWKRFHTGRRAEKPTRGEYSWPESHELGDGIVVESAPTPAGIFRALGPKGPLPLHELIDCTWMRHSLEFQGALLVPEGQRSFFIKLEGMHKGDAITLSFDGPDFLEEAEDGPYFLNALGEVNGAYVGVSASKPEAANLGDAPFELAERTPTSLVFHLTHDARRHDDDAFPQFLEAHIAWCQPPVPRPEKLIRHVVN